MAASGATATRSRADVVTSDVPLGGRALVVSDLHLPAVADETSSIVAERLGATIDTLRGPGLVVLAGDCFDLASQDTPDAREMLAAHPRLAASLDRFACEPDRSVVVLVGGSDAALAQPIPRRHLRDRGYVVGDSLDVAVHTANGTRVVRVEHGALPPLVDDDGDDGDEPAHAAPPELPPFLAGWEHLEDAERVDEMYVSRFVTRRLFRTGLPIVFAAVVADVASTLVDRDNPFARAGLVVTAVLGLLFVLLGAFVARRARRVAVAASAAIGRPPREFEHVLRQRAAILAADGHAGVVSGLTHRPELVELDAGRFVANPGSCDDVTVRYRSWIGMPVYRTVRQMSWIELEGANDLQVRLVVGRTPSLSEPLVERVLARRDPTVPTQPQLVASLPYGPESWSIGVRAIDWTGGVRRTAGIGLTAAAVVNVMSAATAPLHARLQIVRELVPLVVPASARIAAALLGVALFVVARGVRRGHRTAWAAAIVALLASAAASVIKGIDIEEGVLALGLAAWLVANRRAFAVRTPRPVAAPDAFGRAQRVVEQHGGDTLAYFALRDDKTWFFSGQSAVAYAIVRSFCLVSPNPIGPPEEREQMWEQFRAFARDHGWRIAVLGADDDWLRVYRASGMREFYLGDEAIVDVQTFTVEGGANKSLRHGVNRVRRRGYTTRFFDPSTVDDSLRAELVGLMGESRRGDVERGFSMTLGRIFDARDRGLLLAVAFGPDGRAAAFCQYTPAPAISGFSLDLMRRRESDPTNGLTDFVVVETIEHLRRLGYRGLGLNFALLRTVVSGESEDHALARAERRAVQLLGDSAQIESLWRYNEKFRPHWRARYAVVESLADVPAALVAFVSAESLWEVPVIGKIVTRRVRAGATPRA